jgi:hypothetical protein
MSFIRPVLPAADPVAASRSTWGRATRPLWTEEELALYVAARRRKSARLVDPGDGAGGRRPAGAGGSETEEG